MHPHLLIGLEGGYDMQALGEGCEAVAEVLVNDARGSVEEQA